MHSALHTWSLTVLAVVISPLVLLVFRRYSDQAAIVVAKRRIRAHLLAFRLFADEPGVLLRSQVALVLGNCRYLALMLRPTAMTLLPLAFVLFHLDAVYGRRALGEGEAAIVTARLAAARVGAVTLEGAGVVVETPPLRLEEEREVRWRVRQAGALAGSLTLRLEGESLTMPVHAGARLAYLGDGGAAVVMSWLGRTPGTRLEVDYPAAELNVLGMGLHWLVWFSLVLLISMLVGRRFLHVTF